MQGMMFVLEHERHLDDLAEGGEHGNAAGVAAADAAVRVPQAQLQHRRVHRAAQLRVSERALYGHPLRHRREHQYDEWAECGLGCSTCSTGIRYPSFFSLY